jgi:hypothetical protein
MYNVGPQTDRVHQKIQKPDFRFHPKSAHGDPKGVKIGGQIDNARWPVRRQFQLAAVEIGYYGVYFHKCKGVMPGATPLNHSLDIGIVPPEYSGL